MLSASGMVLMFVYRRLWLQQATIASGHVGKMRLLRISTSLFSKPFSTRTSTPTHPKGRSSNRVVDKLRVYVRGGSGGQGLPRQGGVGGDGGSVFVRAARNSSLVSVIRSHGKRIVAEKGGNSSRLQLRGRRGRDVVITVPQGTVVSDDKGVQLCDLDRDGQDYLVAEGGMGGSQASHNYEGHRGQRHMITLELKMIADVGMVGFPNAGKSTLLRALSRATPTVADYPFTTLQPQLGVVEVGASRFTVADLPGLVEGAHSNIGMGHKFLRHIERTKCLLFVVDVSGFQLSHKHQFRDATQTILKLQQELEYYQEGLSSRPAILVLNKIDLQGAKDSIATVMTSINEQNFCCVIPTSASFSVGVSNVATALYKILFSN